MKIAHLIYTSIINVNDNLFPNALIRDMLLTMSKLGGWGGG